MDPASPCTSALSFRLDRPRLHRAEDDPEFRFPAPRDALRRRLLGEMVREARRCEAAERPPARLAERSDSPHPFHQLYVTLHEGMRAQALIEHYAWTGKLAGVNLFSEFPKAVTAVGAALRDLAEADRS